MKKYSITIGLALLVCFSLLIFNISIASAQDVDTTATPELISKENTSAEEELPADVAFDEKVTIEDLNAEEAGVLPGSALHFFKRVGWSMQEIFETDPVANAELKIKHANQELAELKQLIDERGFADISPSTISSVMARFEGRLENVNNVAEALKELKATDPDAVDDLLNDLTDKQFKYQKVFESLERDIIKVKEEDPDAGRSIENAFIKVTEAKDKTLEHFGDVLSKVEEDNPEKIAERIIKIADKQEGSEFKHLKNLEVLKRLEEQVPDNAKGAIALAQENTLKFFNRDMSALPEDARGERFEQYNRFSYGDETRQLSFLDDLKSLEGISPEILQKIEEVKEFAISKFEDKMSHFDRTDVFDSYMGHLSGEDFNDMVIAEQFASRALFEDNPEIKERMDDIRDRSVDEFTARFTDPDSQAQVTKFQELERILEERPGDPKVMKMMQELEDQVRNDPDKAAFLDQMDQLEDKMRFEFEAKFRDEGDRYFDRIGTLDPRDFEVYQEFRGEGFLPDDLAEKFLDHGVDQYRDYMRDVDNPDQFDRFNTKFGDVPQFVIDEIRSRDGDFGEAMQFKRQAMEKLRFEEERKMEIERQQVDYSERELSHQLDRARRQADDEFWQKINSLPYENFDERKTLFEEKRQADLSRLEEEHTARLEMFNKRIELDPWCDSTCQQSQKQFINQEFRHQRERIEDDYISSQRQIESDLSRMQQDQERYKEQQEQEYKQDFDREKDYDCGTGKYFDFRFNECREEVSHTGSSCPFGTFLGTDGNCQKEDFQCPDINAAFYTQCPDGQNREIFTDHNGCKAFSECKFDGDPEPTYCPVFDYLPCADGEIREEKKDENGCIVPGACIPSNITCDAFFTGYEYDSATDRCEARSTSGCSNPYKYNSLTECQNGNITGAVPSAWVNHTWYFSDGSTSSSILDRVDSEYLNYISSIESQCKGISQSSFGWMPGAGDDSSTNWQNFGIPDCSGNADPNPYPYPTETYGNCFDNRSSSSCSLQSGCAWFTNPDGYQYCEGDNFVPPTTPINTNTGYCGDNICNAGEDTYSCSSDCGTSGTTGSMSRCFYPDATIDGNPAGFTVWCEADYFNCHQGEPSAPSVSLDGLSLGAPSWCESGSTSGSSSTNTTTTNESSAPSCEGAGGFACSNGYEYDSNGCVSGCIPEPAPVCMTATDYGHCDYGHTYDTTGCVIGCEAAPPVEDTPPADTTTTDTSTTEDPDISANIWEAWNSLFNF